jgi:hypothetical protein
MFNITLSIDKIIGIIYTIWEFMPRRTDANQKDIVAAFRQLGASVHILSSVGKGCPDIIVGYRGSNYLFEIKDNAKPPSARKLTPAEELFFSEWRGNVQLITSVEEVADFIKHHTPSAGILPSNCT